DFLEAPVEGRVGVRDLARGVGPVCDAIPDAKMELNAGRHDERVTQAWHPPGVADDQHVPGPRHRAAEEVKVLANLFARCWCWHGMSPGRSPPNADPDQPASPPPRPGDVLAHLFPDSGNAGCL